jgi:hypothetical protein
LPINYLIAGGAFYMSNEYLSSTLLGRGVPGENLNEVSDFCVKSEAYIVPKSQTIEDGFELIVSRLSDLVTTQELELIAAKTWEQVSSNPPELIYGEKGFDSSQANRETAKVVSELICLGGVYGEAKMLGVELTEDQIDELLKPQIKVTSGELEILSQVAEKVAGEQDFLFPGVTPTDEETVDLEVLALSSLIGKSLVSVRSVTGLGGLRFDQEWNYLTDFFRFAELKIEEDKRFYPGLGVYYLLSKLDWSGIPALAQLKQVDAKAYLSLKKMVEQLKENKQEKQGYALLCSGYMPMAYEFKHARDASLSYRGEVGELVTNAMTNFHSPSHEFGHWHQLGKVMAVTGESVNFDKSSFNTHLEGVKQWSKGLWSFNSPIHLPWVANLSYLSNHLIGKVKNQRGESAIRFGLGSKLDNKAIELRVYFINQSQVALRWLSYDDVLFEKVVDDEWVFDANHQSIKTVNQKGFFQYLVDRMEEL